MGLTETPSQEYETQRDDEDGEEDVVEDWLDLDADGFLDEAPKGRTINYTTFEDILICTTWRKTRLDPPVGTKQPKETYWQGMRYYFNEHNTSGIIWLATSLRR
jgi:hypothetical protein